MKQLAPEYLLSPLLTTDGVYSLADDQDFGEFASLYSPIRIMNNQVVYIRNDYYPYSVPGEQEAASNQQP